MHQLGKIPTPFSFRRDRFSPSTRQMALTKELVTHVARLAELALSEDELTAMQADLTAILQHVDQLQTLDLGSAAATTHLAVERMPLRAHEPRPGIEHTAARRAAPKALEEGFAVPAFVEDK